MKVTVVGAGAIGGVVGAHLVRLGHDVTFVDTDAAHVAAIRDRGLRISGAAMLDVGAPAYQPDELGGELDVVLLAVKSRHTADALAVVAPRLSATGCVVSLQNGLEEYLIARTVGTERTVGALVTFGGHLAGPGEVVYAGPGTFCLGELDGLPSERTVRLAEALAPFHPVEVTDNITGYLWAKEALGAVYFATALVDADVPEIIDTPGWRQPLGRLVAEVVAVARAHDVVCETLDGFDPTAFADDDSERVRQSWAAQRAYWTRHSQRRTGVWRDLAVHHRKTEVDHILGPIVALANAAAVPVPRLETLVRLVHETESGERSLAWGNLEALR